MERALEEPMRQWTVDAFASEPFRGNQACVVEPLSAWPDVGWMQAVAAENNQAETAFLMKTEAEDRFGLRWFTPALEVPLCGHATLASGHVLFTELAAAAPVLRFDTRSGPLFVSREICGYAMDFPADPPRRTEVPDGLVEALGARPVEVWAGGYLVALFQTADEVLALEPDFKALSRIAGEARGGPGNLAVAALADPGADYDVIDRFFAPGSGIPEDPATGSAHCILGPLYAAKLGRERVRFHQAYPDRGAFIQTTLHGARIRLEGSAVTTIESRLRLTPPQP